MAPTTQKSASVVRNRSVTSRSRPLSTMKMFGVCRSARPSGAAKSSRAMGLGTGGAVDRFIAQINADIGLPKGLADMGVPESFIDETIGKAMKDHCHATNPRIATPDEYRRMLRESW